MYAWLAVWTVDGLLAIYAWLWQVIGKEIVTVHGQTCTIRRDIGGFGFDKGYDLVQMQNLCVEPASSIRWISHPRSNCGASAAGRSLLTLAREPIDSPPALTKQKPTKP
jgi:hypothetical protein